MAYTVSRTEFQEKRSDERNRLWYYLGTAVTVWVVWQAATVVGAVLGAAFPADLSLEYAIP